MAATTDVPPITVHCDGERLVVRVRTDVDLGTTATLADVLRAGLEAGTPMVLDLTDVGDAAARPIAARHHPASRPDQRVTLEITAIGPGLLQLVRVGSCWTVDVSARRLCRSEAPIQPRFVPPEHWTAISRVCVSTEALTAVSACGGLLVTSRSTS